MNTKEDIQNAGQHAQWSACRALMAFVREGGGDYRALATAAFHAGEAWAYFQSRDVIHAYAEKAKKRGTEGKTEGDK